LPFNVTGGVGLHPCGLIHRKAMFFLIRRIALKRRFSALLGTAVNKCRVILGDSISKIAHHRHDFMIAEGNSYTSIAAWSLLLKSHHEIQNSTALGTAVQQIAC
jgi:hypothetical protein